MLAHTGINNFLTLIIIGLLLKNKSFVPLHLSKGTLSANAIHSSSYQYNNFSLKLLSPFCLHVVKHKNFHLHAV